MLTIKNTTGGVLGTQILDEHGNNICGMLGVTSLSIDFPNVNSIISAKVVIGVVKAEIMPAKFTWMTKHPITDKLEAIHDIIFADGTHVFFGEAGVQVTPPDYWDDNAQRMTPVSDGRVMKLRKPAEPDQIPTQGTPT